MLTAHALVALPGGAGAVSEEEEAHMKNRIVTWVVVLGLAMALSGCKSDCQLACEKKQECWRADTNVEECTTTCEDKVEEDKDFANQAKECAECVSMDLVCSELVKQCADDCLFVVGL